MKTKVKADGLAMSHIPFMVEIATCGMTRNKIKVLLLKIEEQRLIRSQVPTELCWSFLELHFET